MKYVWKTKEGKKIRVVDMTDSHVINTRRFLDRKKEEIDKEIDAGWGCLSYVQGEMAEYYCGQDIDFLIQKLHRIEVWKLIFDEEIKRRNLQM